MFKKAPLTSIVGLSSNGFIFHDYYLRVEKCNNYLEENQTGKL